MRDGNEIKLPIFPLVGFGLERSYEGWKHIFTTKHLFDINHKGLERSYEGWKLFHPHTFSPSLRFQV